MMNIFNRPLHRALGLSIVKPNAQVPFLRNWRVCNGLVPIRSVSNSSIKKLHKSINPKAVTPDVTRPESTNSARNIFTPEELEAARLARQAALGPWISKLPEKWIPYVELMRLEKPVGTLLLLLPSFWGITMAAFSIHAPFFITFKAVALFSIGALVMRGAGCTINDILDRNLDNQVARTIERPLASGRVSVPQAVAWLAVQCFGGLAVLLSLPAECFILGAFSLPFVAAYPLFKRFTYYPQAMLSICFSWGCLLGFPAVGAALNPYIAVPLFISNFLWCMTYDTIYAHQDKEFDKEAGIKSTALAWGDKTKSILYANTVVQVATYGIAGAMCGLGPGFYAAAVWGFSRLFNKIKTVDLDNPKSCWNAFTSNIRTGAILWFGILIDYVLLLLGII
ncbi:Piso0_005759 [Millerozyma farinosa CBS 7064]|uniref:4-hydroxybenzoate polyprenyltransferase, mitochondrial n=1 Tax=Pichia sorbitophila (strain ATCC MYA-4447 / BCRC 22081 / CBS 7064 / NBRC 10061 / NRRL Y-12695) TaxID=559304 RepID=G8XZV7_PICSO|nr:Piso0_005759 [Millerozyma farinosa CBS 7064]